MRFPSDPSAINKKTEKGWLDSLLLIEPPKVKIKNQKSTVQNLSKIKNLKL